ncbi:MAG: ferritin [Thiomonas sp. 14-64-326]|jgi:hypothetical protein|uniref:DUF2202 domain-containing protein n=1 Tax=Thiomonas intermedia (strain K12) TaxID=75379 RepID=D5WZU9_THIK1|nr:DUF2202 domain-containing protein [Thiomonas sp.]OZB74805.1 MAG: ferritin [Thiomonas sp. 14-64-326]
MQRRTFLNTTLGAAVLALTGCGGGDSTVAAAPASTDATSATAIAALSTQLDALPPSDLSATEASALVFMREEEKLARDVYQLLYTQWGQKVFSNIAASEQQHMDAVALLLTRYNLPDPAAATAPGVFQDPHVQELFNALMTQGQTSLIAALTVGATIEDLDIQDLQTRIAATDNADIALVFNELMKGSRNHMRAFISQLTKQGVTYTPQYITQAEFDAIINSPTETGAI